jgi:hypothetical protein
MGVVIGIFRPIALGAVVAGFGLVHAVIGQIENGLRIRNAPNRRLLSRVQTRRD